MARREIAHAKRRGKLIFYLEEGQMTRVTNVRQVGLPTYFDAKGDAEDVIESLEESGWDVVALNIQRHSDWEGPKEVKNGFFFDITAEREVPLGE